MVREVYLPECYLKSDEFQKKFIMDGKDKLSKSEKDENDMYSSEKGEKIFPTLSLYDRLRMI